MCFVKKVLNIFNSQTYIIEQVCASVRRPPLWNKACKRHPVQHLHQEVILCQRSFTKERSLRNKHIYITDQVRLRKRIVGRRNGVDFCHPVLFIKGLQSPKSDTGATLFSETISPPASSFTRFTKHNNSRVTKLFMSQMTLAECLNAIGV